MNKKNFIIGFLTCLLCVCAIAAVYRPNIYTTSNADLVVQAGEIITAADGTQTNTFTQPYSSVPTVVVTRHDATFVASSNAPTIISITTSNFTIACGASQASKSNQWMAIGPL